MGSAKALPITLVICAVWLALGPLLAPEVHWRSLLVTNIPTLFTLLMVFLLQHTQNHHNDAVQAKLDELIRAVEGAHNVMVHVEELSPEELVRVRAKYQTLAQQVRASPTGASSTDTPDVEPLMEGPK